MRYGLIGCGAAGKVHAYHFSRNLNIEFVCVADIDDEQIDLLFELFKKYNVPPPKRVYKDYQEMLEKEDLDIVSIATPPKYHLEQVDFASKKGIHILCEKPLAANLEDSKKIIELGKDRMVKIGVMLQRRANNNTNAIRGAIEKGSFGQIKEISFNLKCC